MKIYTKNPYDYNEVSLRKMKDRHDPSLREMLGDSDTVLLGKYLGLETKADFSKYSEKLTDILNWAKFQTDSEDFNKIIDRVKERLNACPQMSDKRINDVWISVKLDLKREKEVPVDHNGNTKDVKNID